MTNHRPGIWQTANKHHLPWNPFAIAWLLTTSVLLLRSWADIIYPPLADEDRTYLLPIYFNAHGFPDITRFYNGYASITPNTLAALLTNLPLTWIPHAFAITSLLICSFAMSLFSSRTYRWLVQDDRHRLAACLLLAALPLGQSLLVSNLTYAQWNMLLALFILLLRDPYLGDKQQLQQAPLILLCIIAHPLSILCVVPCLARLCIYPSRHPLLHIFYMACAIGYNYYYVETGNLDPFKDVEFRFLLACMVFSGRVITETFLGATTALSLLRNDENMPFFALGGLAFLGCCGLLLTLSLVKKSKPMGMLAIFFATGFLVLYASVLTRYNGWGWRIYLNEEYLQRYMYVPRIMTLLTAFTLLAPLLTRLQRWPALNPMLLATFLAFAMFTSQKNAHLYLPSQQRAQETQSFLADVQQEITQGNAACLQFGDCTRTLSAASDPTRPITLDLHGINP